MTQDVITSIVAFIVAIGVLVSVHEFGHYWVARRLGFKVLRYSIGFGKPLWLRTGRDPDRIEYALGAIPLGGYVRLLDERDGPLPPGDAHRAFNRRPPLASIAVLLAGPAANFLFAILAYWLLFMQGMPGLKPVIGEVAPIRRGERGPRPQDEVIRSRREPTGTRQSAVLGISSGWSRTGAFRSRSAAPMAAPARSKSWCRNRTPRADRTRDPAARTRPVVLVPAATGGRRGNDRGRTCGALGPRAR
jgi:regulator of sigma E protease